MHMLNTFKNDLDELRRVRKNHFENANIPKSNTLYENLRQSNVDINPRFNLTTLKFQSHEHIPQPTLSRKIHIAH